MQNCADSVCVQTVIPKKPVFVVLLFVTREGAMLQYDFVHLLSMVNMPF